MNGAEILNCIVSRPKTIFRRAGEGGVTLGALFVCIFLLGTVAGPLTQVMSLALMVYVPFWVYRKLKVTYFASRGLMTFSGLWLEGILLFMCGSIILALGTLVFMQWLMPGYLPAAVGQVAEVVKANPQLVDASVTPEQIVAYFASIRPIDISITLLWGASFTGSIASIVIAGLVKAKSVPPPPPPQSIN